MMAQPFAAHAGMGPGGGHPGLPHGHPMAGMQHPGAGHMGGPNPAMMQGMHPGVSGPQVTQGPMVPGMPQGPVTSGPGGPMQNAHAMAHLGPGQPNPMFQQANQQQVFAQMPPGQQQAMMRQRQQLFQQMQQQQQQQNMAGMMQQHGGQNMTPQHFAQLKAGMNMPMQQQMQLHAQANAQAQNLQQQHHQQQRLMAHQQQQQMLAQQQQQRNASQQMTLSRSQEQASQPPQSHPTPAPQNPTQMQQQPAPPTPVPGAQSKQQQQQPPQPNPQQQPQQSQVGTPQQSNDTIQQAKQQDMGPNLNALEDVPMSEGIVNGINGQGILRLLMFQEQLCPPSDKLLELGYWEDFVHSHFSPVGVLRQQLCDPKKRTQKTFQIQFASLARFYHAHFASGIREMRMEPIGCTETKLPHGGCNVYSPKTYITYGYDNDIRVITEGWIQCNFDMGNRIEHLSINTKAWTEYIPRGLWPEDSLDQKQSPKMTKNLKRPQQKAAAVPSAAPSSCIGEWGMPDHIVYFLEIAEVMMVMGPLMEYSQKNPELRPQEAMHRMVAETAHAMRFQNQMAAQGNSMGPGQRTPGLNGPNQFASPGMNHLGLPQQGSPHIGGPTHTPSPAHMNQGGIAMVHQMSQGNSNLSGSQGPSTNTSPNVTNKRRRASQVKLEEDSASQEVNGANKVKPSPRIGGKRQKGTA